MTTEKIGPKEKQLREMRQLREVLRKASSYDQAEKILARAIKTADKKTKPKKGRRK